MPSSYFLLYYFYSFIDTVVMKLIDFVNPILVTVFKILFYLKIPWASGKNILLVFLINFDCYFPRLFVDFLFFFKNINTIVLRTTFFLLYALFFVICIYFLAMHSRILAWKIPWTEEPGSLQSMGSQRVEYNWAHTHIELLYLW